MPFVPSANVAHIQFIGESDGQETDNNLYFISTAPPITALSLQTLTDTLSDWYGTSLIPLTPTTWSYSHARGRDLTSQNSFIATSTNGQGTGEVASEATPGNVTVNMTFSTGLAGRNNHGSNRFPVLNNGQVDINAVDVGLLGDILTAYGQLLAPSGTLPGGWTWVVLSQYSGFTLVDGKKVPTPRVAGIAHEIFDIFFTDNVVDSQKTRLPKHGR